MSKSKLKYHSMKETPENEANSTAFMEAAKDATLKIANELSMSPTDILCGLARFCNGWSQCMADLGEEGNVNWKKEMAKTVIQNIALNMDGIDESDIDEVAACVKKFMAVARSARQGK
jgi:hypothetical protein